MNSYSVNVQSPALGGDGGKGLVPWGKKKKKRTLGVQFERVRG